MTFWSNDANGIVNGTTALLCQYKQNEVQPDFLVI